MEQSGGEQAPVHDVHRGLALLREGADLVLGARSWSLPPEQVREALAEVSRLAASVEGARLHLVRASVAGDDGARPGRETAQWMASELRVDAGRARAGHRQRRDRGPRRR